MTFENKPKRAPPARFANKAKKEEKEDKGPENDVEMKDEETKKPEPKKKASPTKSKPAKVEKEDEEMAESNS